MERNTHLFRRMRNFFAVICRGENLFRLEWSKEETKHIVRNDPDVIKSMTEIEYVLYSQGEFRLHLLYF
jgi:hypothetical protein